MRARTASLALAALVMAGCTGAHNGTTPQSGFSMTKAAATGERAAIAPDVLDPTKINPVVILRMTGATPNPGSVNGLWTSDRNALYANGVFYGPPGSADDGVPTDRAFGEQVSVYTFSTQAEQDYSLTLYKPDDANAVITGKGFIVLLTGMSPGPPFGGIYGPHPAQVAARVHGSLVPGSPR